MVLDAYLNSYNFDFLELLHVVFALNGCPLDDVIFFGTFFTLTISTVGLNFAVFFLKNKMIKLMEIFHGANLNSSRHCWENRAHLTFIILAWMLFPVIHVIALTMRLISRADIDFEIAAVFGVTFFALAFIIDTAPFLSFLIMFTEPCNQLNLWIKSLVQKIKYKASSDNNAIFECKHFLNEGKAICIKLAIMICQFAESNCLCSLH